MVREFWQPRKYIQPLIPYICSFEMGNMDLTRQKKINELVNENYVYAIQDYAVAHDAHDDELTSIRNITDNYKSKTSDPLPIKVLYSELQSFERELITHARVENDILFPKALMLEKEVRQLVHDNVKLN